MKKRYLLDQIDRGSFHSYRRQQQKSASGAVAGQSLMMSMLKRKTGRPRFHRSSRMMMALTAMSFTRLSSGSGRRMVVRAARMQAGHRGLHKGHCGREQQCQQLFGGGLHDRSCSAVHYCHPEQSRQ
jgi:hypothetical protein